MPIQPARTTQIPRNLILQEGGKTNEQLTQALMEELTVEYVKVGPLQIPESVVISWVIMVLVVTWAPSCLPAT